ncbi:hypothetical protein HU200_039031 [Digitaria exilis]|uniref:Uncharacterized protein n=1 Tax=Digitaria exilis TaxID=1010633 RepID=A0A835BNF7_9POAL|nr:hypothetical protein HU200_039031 [Digitaria exilis]
MAKFSSKIRYIVWLRQTLRRWRSRAAARAAVVPAGHGAAEEEYGFPSGARAGPIALPCDEGLLERVLRHLSSPSKSSRFLTLEDLKTGALSGCCVAAAAAAGGDSLPLLHGIAADKAVW